MHVKNKVLHILILIAFVFFSSGSLWAQTGFKLPKGKKSGAIKFELVNNLVVVPVEINNVKLSFILDTGVTSTLLFGATRDTLELKNTSTVLLRGLGKGKAVEALKSDRNHIRIGRAIDLDHSLYVIFDEELNFSNRMGIPIHGILGYDFFKNFVVSISYSSKTIKYATPENFKERRKRGYITYPMRIEKGRPFINNVVINDGEESLMLVDIGSSDSIWIFDDVNIISENEHNYFVDFLGLGISGSIYGKRSRVSEVAIGEFSFQDVNIAIPETQALVNARMMEGRKGSIGSQLMKRFNVIFNYPKSEISLKKNTHYDDPFYYNMSGLTLEHDGISLVRTAVGGSRSIAGNVQDSGTETRGFAPTANYKITLAPAIVVAEVRENSTAALADVRVGDKLVLINGKFTHEYKLYEITSMFSSREGKLISLKIERDGERFKKKFYLKKLF
jgi:hypothetical protein